MKIQLTSALLAALFAGSALAQSTAPPPQQGGAVNVVPGTAQGRVPTATNSPAPDAAAPQRDTAKQVLPDMDKDKTKAVSKPEEVQGTTATAAKKAKAAGYPEDKSAEIGADGKKATPAISLTNPQPAAPGTVPSTKPPMAPATK